MQYKRESLIHFTKSSHASNDMSLYPYGNYIMKQQQQADKHDIACSQAANMLSN